MNKVKELNESLIELIDKVSKDKTLSVEFIKGYIHMASMIVKWCNRQEGIVTQNKNSYIGPVLFTKTFNRLDN